MAHELLKVINFLRDNNLEQYFLPWLMNSQICEGTFRALRAMTSTFSTMCNFNLGEFIDKIHRIDFINEMESLLNKTYNISELEEGIWNTHKLPSILEIEKTIIKSNDRALHDLKKLGIDCTGFGKCKVRSMQNDNSIDETDDIEQENSEPSTENHIELLTQPIDDLNVLLGTSQHIDLKDMSQSIGKYYKIHVFCV